MHGEYKVPGGKLVVADLNVTDGCLADVCISGDFSWSPIPRWMQSTRPCADCRQTAAKLR